MTQDDPRDEGKQEAERFLERDFNQSFAQLRYYDGQIWDVCKFTFTGYAVLLSTAIGLYKYSVERQLDLIPAAVAALSVGVVLGIFMFFLAVRNRVYFVFVARYINEHRRFFLTRKPLGFPNVTRMYTNPSQPPFLDWRSSETWLLWVIALLNSIVLGVLVFILLDGWKEPFLPATLVGLILLFVQFLFGTCYLHSRESKSADKGVFGKDNVK